MMSSTAAAMIKYTSLLIASNPLSLSVPFFVAQFGDIAHVHVNGTVAFVY
jgi:hypothetical protein